MSVRREECSESDIAWMQHAIDLARQSQAENERRDIPKVGAVIVRDGELLAGAFRGETGPGDHAEFAALSKTGDGDLVGATVYTTLEPCTERGSEKTPCADHLIDRRVGTVFIGMFDPNPVVHRRGWRRLRDAGIHLRDFEESLRDSIVADNLQFVETFRVAIGMEGVGTFDYLLNDGRFEIFADEDRAVGFRTQWRPGGKGSIYAVDQKNLVALPKHARDFAEVDDPGADEFSTHAVLAQEGEIAIFRNDHGYVLVRVEGVLSGPTYGDDRTELQIKYQLRLR